MKNINHIFLIVLLLNFASNSIAFSTSSAIYEKRISHDTLYLISNDDSIYYPFGIFDCMEAFSKAYGNDFVIKKEFQHPYGDSSMPAETLYRMVNKDSFIKLILIKKGGSPRAISSRMEIVSANIQNNFIAFRNGIHVGISLSALLRILFKEPINFNTKTISIVANESVVTGITFYYSASNGIIKNIQVKTDFCYNQE